MKKVKEYSFKKIDAFATENSEGNPAGYIRLDSFDDISDGEMLQIAKELKGYVNEVGYISQTGENAFDLRYFSSEREVDFCGHATIAIMYDMVKSNSDFAKKDTAKVDRFVINTNRGSLEAENRVDSENSVFIMSPEPVEKDSVPETDDIAVHLKIEISKIDPNRPVSIINAGLSTLIVPLIDLDTILKISPDLKTLNQFCVDSGIDIIEVYTSDVYDKVNNFRVRVFAPTFGYLEDPATGSGNSAFGYYLIKNNMWNGETIQIEQNGERERFNIVKLQKRKDKKDMVRVCFGGGAVTRIEGIYKIYR